MSRVSLTNSGVGAFDSARYAFFWKTPVSGACVKTASFRIPSMTYNYLDFAYELRTPNPLGMSSGLYTGSLNYTIGPHGDFDMGDVLLPDDGNLTLDFVLDVQHTLKVDIPPGGNKVELVPQGGWQAWLQQGRKPVRLYREQTFNISASSRFKMLLQCQYTGINGCELREQTTGSNIPIVTVSVSLPQGITDENDQPVKQRRLYLDGRGTRLFKPAFYVDRAPGILHFEVAQLYMDYIVQPGQAARYSGNVIVVWDSEI